MRRARSWVLVVAAGIGVGVSVGTRAAEAADPEVSISLEPMRYAFVSGDQDKFRAHHWMKEGYVGGLKNLSLKYGFPDGTELSAESHALIDQNDLGADFSLKKDRLGFFKLDYDEFRKYYDKTGGVYRPFSTLSGVDTFKDLHLDIGHLALETGLTLEGWPELSFFYERKFKNGAKSRLTWTPTKESSLTRYIGPSWQDIDETVDTVALKANHELAGFTLKGEQRWEFMRAETLREEKFLSNTGATADTLIRRQDQAPQANLVTTLLEGERWFLNDKAFFASAYRVSLMANREFETLGDIDTNGNQISSSKNRFNARADNKYRTHTWAETFMVSPWSWLGVVTKFKTEVLKRRSNSSYPSDTTNPPDGIPNTTDQSITDNKAVRWGEGISLRFTGIPRTALYNDLEFEQSRILLREDRISIAGQSASDSGETFSRQTVSKVWRGVWTLGGQTAPWSFLSLTAHVRHRQNNIDYDNERHTDPGATTARSAFFDGQNISTNEFATRVALTPCRWARTSFRYQFRGDKYATRTFDNNSIVKTGTTSHIYTYDVTLQPLQNLSTTTSFSRQTALTYTPARFGSSVNIPAFHADVNTWLLSADYTPKPTVTVSQTFLFSRAKNFNDYVSTGLPYGADFSRVDLTTGLTWSPKKDVSMKTEYDLYHFNSNDNAETGDYTAHVIWFDVSKKF